MLSNKEILNCKEGVYILGLLWADGSIGTKYNEIRLEIIKDDADLILPLMLQLGDWNIYNRQRQAWQPVTTIYKAHKDLHRLLIENDYLNKSYASPNKILSLVPHNLKHYWFRGYFDGDGCFYFNSKQYLYQFSLSSTFEQDWSFMIDLFNQLNINKYSVCRRTSKKGHRCSHCRITNKHTVRTLGNYIYENNFDGIGLSRKYEKYKQILTVI